jgi:hypothetical protein
MTFLTKKDLSQFLSKTFKKNLLSINSSKKMVSENDTDSITSNNDRVLPLDPLDYKKKNLKLSMYVTGNFFFFKKKIKFKN